jgi:hypothetical protein
MNKFLTTSVNERLKRQKKKKKHKRAWQHPRRKKKQIIVMESGAKLVRKKELGAK